MEAKEQALVEAEEEKRSLRRHNLKNIMIEAYWDHFTIQEDRSTFADKMVQLSEVLRPHRLSDVERELTDEERNKKKKHLGDECCCFEYAFEKVCKYCQRMVHASYELKKLDIAAEGMTKNACGACVLLYDSQPAWTSWGEMELLLTELFTTCAHCARGVHPECATVSGDTLAHYFCSQDCKLAHQHFNLYHRYKLKRLITMVAKETGGDPEKAEERMDQFLELHGTYAAAYEILKEEAEEAAATLPDGDWYCSGCSKEAEGEEAEGEKASDEVMLEADDNSPTFFPGSDSLPGDIDNPTFFEETAATFASHTFLHTVPTLQARVVVRFKCGTDYGGKLTRVEEGRSRREARQWIVDVHFDDGDRIRDFRYPGERDMYICSGSKSSGLQEDSDEDLLESQEMVEDESQEMVEDESQEMVEDESVLLLVLLSSFMQTLPMLLCGIGIIMSLTSIR
jgi:hypothetical protein